MAQEACSFPTYWGDGGVVLVGVGVGVGLHRGRQRERRAVTAGEMSNVFTFFKRQPFSTGCEDI